MSPLPPAKRIFGYDDFDISKTFWTSWNLQMLQEKRVTVPPWGHPVFQLLPVLCGDSMFRNKNTVAPITVMASRSWPPECIFWPGLPKEEIFKPKNWMPAETVLQTRLSMMTKKIQFLFLKRVKRCNQSGPSNWILGQWSSPESVNSGFPELELLF